MELRFFYHLPPSLKILSDEMKQCRPALKHFLLTNSFNSINIFIGNELKSVCVCARARVHGVRTCVRGAWNSSLHVWSRQLSAILYPLESTKLSTYHIM